MNEIENTIIAFLKALSMFRKLITINEKTNGTRLMSIPRGAISNSLNNLVAFCSLFILCLLMERNKIILNVTI